MKKVVMGGALILFALVMRTELGKQFARYPVYTLHFDNAKTATARLILRRVQIDHGVLVLTLGI